ncbi:MAG: TlyA family RNA methyltransferase [Clostridia bacterium]|nr:TlyA family RNA methyltransferase [Clostridia bacterium]
MRADLFLYSRGFARSRTHAAELIKNGVELCGKKIGKPSQDIPESTPDSEIKIIEPSKYVSRGGLKLEAALTAFSVETAGAIALDVGASTGGFTDCLLQHGAAKVYAVDVGHGQLAEELIADTRVVNLEGINAKVLSPELIGHGGFELAVSDVSFISQSLIYAPVCAMLAEGGKFISLIKPQFECGRKNLSSGGICKDKKVHLRVVAELFEKARLSELYPAAFARSPITGGDGNTEYLALFIKGEKSAYVSEETVKNCILGG